MLTNTVSAFFTLAPLAVAEGDVLTFGPAIADQGWHLVTLDASKAVTGEGTIHNGITKGEAVETNTAILGGFGLFALP